MTEDKTPKAGADSVVADDAVVDDASTELTSTAAADVPPSETESAVGDTAEAPVEPASGPEAGTDWGRIVAFVVLPVLALVLGATAGFLKWQDNSVRNADVVRDDSVQVARDATVKLLSYKPDTVEQDLGSARDLLTGEFRDSYTQLINDVVIPGSKEKLIAASATVPAAASVSAEANRAVVLVFVNQTVMVGTDAPTATTSSVQVTMERVGDRWLISEFEPV